MNFLHYLYVKADKCPRYDGTPRVVIAWPLWLSSLWYLPITSFMNSSFGWISTIIAFIFWYLVVLAVYPPRMVKNKYKDWENEYEGTTSLWFWIYFFSFIIPMSLRILYWVNHPAVQ